VAVPSPKHGADRNAAYPKSIIYNELADDRRLPACLRMVPGPLARTKKVRDIINHGLPFALLCATQICYTAVARHHFSALDFPHP
jgi:hypothetical protein